jgi:hypothetical protein
MSPQVQTRIDAIFDEHRIPWPMFTDNKLKMLPTINQFQPEICELSNEAITARRISRQRLPIDVLMNKRCVQASANSSAPGTIAETLIRHVASSATTNAMTTKAAPR